MATASLEFRHPSQETVAEKDSVESTCLSHALFAPWRLVCCVYFLLMSSIYDQVEIADPHDRDGTGNLEDAIYELRIIRDFQLTDSTRFPKTCEPMRLRSDLEQMDDEVYLL